MQPDQIFNCDKKDIIISCIKVNSRGIVSTSRFRKRHYVYSSSNHKLAIILKTISATGTVLLLFLVLSGSYQSVKWYTDFGDKEATFSVQANAIMDIELGKVYIKDHFNTYTAPVIASGRGYQLLIIDSYKLNILWKLMQYCLDYNIWLLYLLLHLMY